MHGAISKLTNWFWGGFGNGFLGHLEENHLIYGDMSTLKSDLLQASTCAEFLQSVFDKRKNKNPRYSLRSYAKLLDMTHSYLSGILMGKKKLPPGRAFNIANRLGLDPAETELFIELIEGRPRQPTHDMMKMPLITEGQKSLFSRWYHMVILELATLPKLHLTPTVAAKSIGIPITEIETAFKTLVELGFLEKTNEGSYSRCSSISVRRNTPDEIIENYGLQLLDKIRDGNTKIAVSKRAFGSKIFPMSQNQFKVLQERIFSLIHDIMLEGMEGTSKEEYDTVYLIAAHILPVASFSQIEN